MAYRTKRLFHHLGNQHNGSVGHDRGVKLSKVQSIILAEKERVSYFLERGVVPASTGCGKRIVGELDGGSYRIKKTSEK